MPSQFPPDQDLPPEAVSLTTIIPASATFSESRRILEGLRGTYRHNTGEPGDVILMAVPAGTGRPFAEGLALALQQAKQGGHAISIDDPPPHGLEGETRL